MKQHSQETRRMNGSCLCGGVRYETSGPLLYAGYCHCSQCRKFSGSALSAFGGLYAASFFVVQGADLLGSYEKTPAKRMRFCTQCGSSLFTEKPLSNTVHLRLGTLDTEPSVWPQFHVHVESLPTWSTICDGLPCVDGNPTEQQTYDFRDQARALRAARRTS